MRSKQDSSVSGERLNAIKPDPEERDEDMLDEDELAEDDTIEDDDDELDIEDDTDGSPTR
jgi:hypothetical protein